jgi:hypothetical protein
MALQGHPSRIARLLAAQRTALRAGGAHCKVRISSAHGNDRCGAQNKAIDALDRYIDCRLARRFRTTDDPGRYRGLVPSGKLILTHKGYKFHLNTKRCVSWAGEPVSYLACDSLQSTSRNYIWTQAYGAVHLIAADAPWPQG